MTNVPFGDISDFRDLDSVNAYYELTQKGIFSPESMLRRLRWKSRDNARSPMQWDAGQNAGFTTGTPWIMVNPNYTTINAAEQLERSDSVFHYYQKLIALRHAHSVIVYGDYRPLWEENEHIFAYERTLSEDGRTVRLLVLCSFSNAAQSVELPAEYAGGELLICNYADGDASGTLRPWEAKVLMIEA